MKDKLLTALKDKKVIAALSVLAIALAEIFGPDAVKIVTLILEAIG